MPHRSRKYCGEQPNSAIIRISGELDVPVAVMQPVEAAQRYPQFRLRPDFILAFCPLNGFLAIDDCLRAQAALARAQGALLQDEEPVLGIEPLAHGAQVRTARAAYTCDKLVITAGPYAKSLLAQLGLDVPYTVELNQSI